MDHKTFGRWVILGCNEDGYWIAGKFQYTFKTKPERIRMLKMALEDATKSIPGLYTIVEI